MRFDTATTDDVDAPATDVSVSRSRNGVASPGPQLPQGVEPSGGQWQRLAIARSLFPTDPLVLVLDEPTSAIDPLHEAELLRRYAAASDSVRRRGGITVVISHRFASVALADHIIVLDDGTIAEEGTHDELVAAGGRYAAMYRTQQTAYE